MTNGKIAEWLRGIGAVEVEAFMPDISGVPRGKIMPCEKFLTGALRMPESAIAQTVTGEWGDQEDYVDEVDGDMELRAEIGGCFVVPWAKEPTGQIICDCISGKGSLLRYAPRSVLRRVLGFYRREGWQPQVAPEIEFYLAARDNNPDNPLRSPVGRTGRPEFSSQPFNIDAANEFEDVIEDIYRFAEAQSLDVDTLIHEEGAAQFEINFKHGEPLNMADQMLMFKRCVREAAIRRGVAATFMAKPLENYPGSSMHVHQSVWTREGKNIFSDGRGGFGPKFMHYIGGLQKHLPDIAAMLLPNVNSFKRINIEWPVANAHWGVNNRTVGLRVPQQGAEPSAMRVENRVSGADANPYLAIAATLLAGFVGVKQKLQPRPQVRGAAWEMPRGIPPTLESALAKMRESKMLRERLGNRFVDLYAACKSTELENYQHVVTSWERRYLLDI